MSKIRFIGDIHGLYLPYIKLIENVEHSVQVGDFGYGFGTKGRASFVEQFMREMPGKHLCIRGNHDSPSEIAKSPYWIPDGTVDGNVMYIGGASSIDRAWRTEGLNWWPDEQLSDEALDQMVDKYTLAKPEIMVTHEAPEFLVEELIKTSPFGRIEDYSRTREAFARMWGIHKPQTWIFGHWHQSLSVVIGDTKFICLDELEYIDLEI